MPHRIFAALQPLSTFIELTTLSFLAMWQGVATVISDSDWAKITGPNGLVFVLIIGLIVLWAKSIKDDAARERRHQETLKTQKENFNALLELNHSNANDLKQLSIESTKAQMSSTSAIISMDHNIIRLTNEISDNMNITHSNKQ